MISSAVYPGSFDPWSLGHAFVLAAGLEIFQTIHICVAVNPSKKGILDPVQRSYLIAKSIAPFHYFDSTQSPHTIADRVRVDFTYGLVSEYSRSLQVSTLIRGLRSTSDFEAEFNLYFSNYAISPKIKTWTVMCPPELLHCSSTYVRTVVGQPTVGFVGTGFLSQCYLLKRPPLLGEIFDILAHFAAISDDGFRQWSGASADEELQRCFAEIIDKKHDKITQSAESELRKDFDAALKNCTQTHPNPFHLSEEDRSKVYRQVFPLMQKVLSSFLQSDLSAPTKSFLSTAVLCETREMFRERIALRHS